MAFVTSELEWIVRLLSHFDKNHETQVLSLGYPDLLSPKSHLVTFVDPGTLENIPYRSDSTYVANDHNRPILLSGIYDSYAFFKALNVNLTTWDLHDRFPNSFIVDLNAPNDVQAAFDMILDPGTTEHIFNISTAMTTLAKLVKVNGYIVHSTPLHHLNHGYYNFSPVFYNDFYTTNGFEMVLCAQKVARQPESDNGLLLNFLPLDTAKPFGLPGDICHGFFVVKKIHEPSSYTIPIQKEFA